MLFRSVSQSRYNGCRFRSASEIHKSKQGFQPQGLNIQNDPVAWITDEVEYNKYKKLNEDLKEALKNRSVDMAAQFADNAEGSDEEAAAGESRF